MFRFVNKLRNRKGFTLVELIVVLAVLAIIGIIAVPKFLGIQAQAKKDADVATSAMVADALRIYVAAEKVKLSGLSETAPGSEIATIGAKGVGFAFSEASKTIAGFGKDAADLTKLQKYLDAKSTVMQSGITVKVYMDKLGNVTVKDAGTGTKELYPTNEYTSK